MFPPSLTRSNSVVQASARQAPPSLTRSNAVVQASAGQAARERVAWSVTSAVDAGSIRRCFATAARSARIGITTCASGVTAPR